MAVTLYFWIHKMIVNSGTTMNMQARHRLTTLQTLWAWISCGTWWLPMSKPHARFQSIQDYLGKSSTWSAVPWSPPKAACRTNTTLILEWAGHHEQIRQRARMTKLVMLLQHGQQPLSNNFHGSAHSIFLPSSAHQKASCQTLATHRSPMFFDWSH